MFLFGIDPTDDSLDKKGKQTHPEQTNNIYKTEKFYLNLKVIPYITIKSHFSLESNLISLEFN